MINKKNQPDQKNRSSSEYFLAKFGPYIAVAIAIGFFLALVTEVARYATQRGLWNDEVLSIWILKQPFSEMLKSTYSGYDGMLPLFYILSWPIVSIVPVNEILARWLQIIPALVAPWIIFRWLANRISLRATALAVMPTVWFFSQYTNLSWHLRSYGFLLFATAAAIVILDTPADRRTRKWMTLNAVIQFFLVSGQPFGILYCFILGLTRWLCDLREKKGLFDKNLVISYIPALVGILLWTPAILSSRRLMEPISWQPTTTLSNLQTILAPGISSLWPAAFFGMILLLLCAGKTAKSNPTPSPSLYFTMVPLACIATTLVIWAYSLSTPLYLDRYFIPNVWAWTIVGTMVIAKIDAVATNAARSLALVSALVFSLSICISVIGPKGGGATKQGIELTHILFQGTRDDELVDKRYPVYTFDLNVFMERMHYNPKTLEYRAVFERADPPLDPKTSYTERKLAEGMVKLGMPKEILLDPLEAISEIKARGGATFLGVKRTNANLQIMQELQNSGFKIETQQINIGGTQLVIDRISSS